MLIKKISPKNRENYNDLVQVIENLKKGSTHIPGIETKEIVKLIKSGSQLRM